MILKIVQYILPQKNLKRFCATVVVNKMAAGEEKCALSLKKVVDTLETFAPKKLSETWDNTGLLVEPFTPRNISNILLTNDLTERVAVEAFDRGCELIISYHPPIFAPLKSVVQNTWKERIVAFLLEKRIALYSPHTSWDSVLGGVNDWLASAFPILDCNPIIPGENPQVGAGRILKISTSVTLKEAIAKVKGLTGLNYVRLALGNGKQLGCNINTVAVCAGSGTSVLRGVEADLYLTGEMLHHDILDATQRGISVILTNHSDSERGFLKEFSADLQKLLNNEAKVFVSELDKDPITTI